MNADLGVNPFGETRGKRRTYRSSQINCTDPFQSQHGHMLDRGFFITQQAIRRQLAAMPHDLYLIRLIHHATRRAFPGERLWTAAQLTSAATIRFLRLRNGEGCDIYLHPYAEDRNAGYILLDLDA